MSAPPLKLRRLDLSGFKSFVDPVSLDFAGAITAIVGPNGCGKSNLADSVIWVLGERSAKSLRGSKMEDVIFGGARGRKPLGMAQVSLELSTDPGFRDLEDGRLTIGRRVFRTGESQYTINGKTVRLKDIRDLLMDTGLGLRGYAMIEQGQIGMILSGKPQERRRLLEEAAGVTRYRERRRIAEYKLEEAQANLTRLDDILSEVGRSLRSLKRQSNAARRYRHRQLDYQELRGKLLHARWAVLNRRLGEGRRAIELQSAREAELTADLHRKEAALAAAREAFEELQTSLGERHRRESELAAAIEGRQEFLTTSRERLEDFGERLAAGREASRLRERRRSELAETRERLAAQRRELIAERDRAAADLDDDEVRIRRAEGLVEEAGQRVESLRARLLASIADLTGLRNRLHREQVEREKGDLRLRHLRAEAERQAGEEAEARTAADAARTRLAELTDDTERLEQKAESLRTKLQEMTDQLRELARDREQSTAALSALRQRQELLVELAEADRARREEVEAALEEAGLGGLGCLTDRAQVPEGWAESLDLYLGRLAQAVVLPTDEDGLALAETLAAGGAGGCLLRPAEGDELSAPAPDDPAIRAAVGEALGLPETVARALPPAYLVDSPADAERLARQHPGCAFLSRERLWAQAGVLHLRSERAVPGLLARDQEMNWLAAEIQPLERHLEGLVARSSELSAAIDHSRESLDRIDGRLAERRQELAVVRARHEDLDARARRLEVEHETLATESAELERELTRVSAQSERAGADLVARETAHRELEESFDRAQAEAAALRDDRESTRTSGVSRRGRLELVDERLAALEQQLARCDREVDESGEQEAGWRQEAERLGERRTQLGARIEAAERSLQDALERRDISQREVLAAQSRVDDQRAELERLETAIAALREDRDRVREEISEHRVAQAALDQETEHLEEEFRGHFDGELPEVPEPPEEPLDQLEEETERCRGILERLGPVNLLAAEEHSEQEERHRFLSEQRADVADSVASLRQTIREIDETSSGRFRATFEAVNEQFRELFQELFRGGTAEMRLLDEEDFLDSGIEIVARPPGKRLQNLMLLSGGEKALTAIALVFALFRTKPSPFCILDEVDAPLDDVNTLRYLELVKRLSQETQFVLITHNKLTMEAASLLYGVTMQEKGVSNLVAVELDDVQPGQIAEPTAAETEAATA